MANGFTDNEIRRYERCVSVVIPFYNSNMYLNDAIASVQSNSYFVKEIVIVVDKGSIEPEVKSCNAKDVSIIYNASDNRGAGYVRWLGAKHATGSFIAFVDADDIWDDKKLKTQLHMMIRHKIDFTFMAFKHFKTSDAHGQPSPDNFTPHVPKGPFTLERFLRKNFVVPCLTVVISRRCLGGIRPNTLKRRNDYYMWYGLIKYIERNNMKWVGMTELGGYHRIHTGSLTSSRIKSVFHQYLFYKHCGFGFKERARYMLSYLCNTIGSR